MEKKTPVCLSLSKLEEKQIVAFGEGVSEGFVLNQEGQVYAYSGVCPHLGGPLVRGKIDAKRNFIECPWHRYRFELRNGRCLTVPGKPWAVDSGVAKSEKPLPIKLKKLPLAIREDCIFVYPGFD